MVATKVRSAGSQIDRMTHRWPELELFLSNNGWLKWQGPIRGFQLDYRVAVLWKPESELPPYVMLVDPPLRPRIDGDYGSIPHLWFDKDDPERSGLCLFDPEKREWDTKNLIADTTIPWAARWLLYYELWLVDGIWRGTGRAPTATAPVRPPNLC